LAKVSFLPVWLGPFGYPESCPDIAVGSRVDRRIGNIQLCVHLNSALPICQLFISICHLLAFTLCLDKGYIAACFPEKSPAARNCGAKAWRAKSTAPRGRCHRKTDGFFQIRHELALPKKQYLFPSRLLTQRFNDAKMAPSARDLLLRHS